MSESKKELYAALSKAQGSYKQVKKSGLNNYFKDSDGNPRQYPTLADFIEASGAALSANGLSVSQDLVTNDKGETLLMTTLAHASGEFKAFAFKLIVAKNDMQALGSATTYGRRYAYAAVCGLAPEDDDGNLAVDNSAKKDPSVGSENYMVTFGKYSGKVLKEIPSDDLQNYCRYIENQAKEKNKPISGAVAEFMNAASYYLYPDMPPSMKDDFPE
jgi:hypothetical protein